jgi:Cytochrome bd terminal oxidase subunit II
MVLFWVFVLAVATLPYVLLDGFDLGVGILFGATRNEAWRRAMLSAVAPVWDGNETWLVAAGVVLWAAFPPVYATLLSAFYLPLLLMLAGLILRRRQRLVPQTKIHGDERASLLPRHGIYRGQEAHRRLGPPGDGGARH